MAEGLFFFFCQKPYHTLQPETAGSFFKSWKGIRGDGDGEREHQREGGRELTVSDDSIHPFKIINK